jgi:serine/threonine protein kinase
LEHLDDALGRIGWALNDGALNLSENPAVPHRERKSGGLKRGELIRTAFDTYKVERQVGAGGSGIVYEALDTEAARFAIKVLDVAKAGATRLKRFKNETNFCLKNTHKNIIRVLGTGLTDAGAVFYVMPLYQRTLRDLMGGIRSADVLSLYGQILDGVEAAHLQGIWHRDLKPENILYSPADHALVVADFGIAHFEEEELLTAVETKPGERLANFLYAAPEQKVRGRTVDQKADIYALGLILHEMFSNEVPLGTGHRKVADAAPEFAYLDPLIELMRNQEPTRRPSIGEVKQELIARGHQFIERQRLNAMKKEIVPESKITDSIVANPIRLTGKEDYRNGILILKLNQSVNKEWVACFQHRATRFDGNVSSAVVSFEKDRVKIIVPEHFLQQGVRFVQDYLTPANEDYAAQVKRDHLEKIKRRNLALQTKISQEEARQRILEKIKI